MDELKALLKNNIILKEDKKELYYAIKDNYKDFKSFIRDKLGYNLILRGDFIKLEMIPGSAESWMGIEEFNTEIEYVMLMLLLVFLEDKDKDDQFLLSHITEALSSNDIDVKFQWTDYSSRRNLIKVIKFAVKNKLLTITDGNEESFALDTSKEILFESTGISKYMVRVFEQDILSHKEKDILFPDLISSDDSDRGAYRKYRVYRKLLLSPIVYRNDSIEDYEYIKNYRKFIEEDFQKYLGWTLHVHKNGAMVIPNEKDNGFYLFPNAKGISDVILHILSEIQREIKKGILTINKEDEIYINKIDFEQLIIKVRQEKSHGWSKEYRDMTEGKLFSQVIDEMLKYSFIRECKETICIMSLCGKIVGDYPEDYQWEENCEK